MGKKEAAEAAGVSERTLDRMRETGDGPRYVRLGKRRIGYEVDEFDRWLKANTFSHRADEAARTATVSQPRAA